MNQFSSYDFVSQQTNNGFQRVQWFINFQSTNLVAQLQNIIGVAILYCISKQLSMTSPSFELHRKWAYELRTMLPKKHPPNWLPKSSNVKLLGKIILTKSFRQYSKYKFVITKSWYKSRCYSIVIQVLLNNLIKVILRMRSISTSFPRQLGIHKEYMPITMVCKYRYFIVLLCLCKVTLYLIINKKKCIEYKRITFNIYE